MTPGFAFRARRARPCVATCAVAAVLLGAPGAAAQPAPTPAGRALPDCDEHVSLAQLEEGIRFMVRLLRELDRP